MIRYAVLDAEGYVVRAGVAPVLPSDAVAVTGDQDPLLLRRVEGEFVARPPLPDPVITALTPGLRVQWDDLPAGTVAVITDLAWDYEFDPQSDDAGVILMDLVSPGSFRIDLTPPRPHLERTVIITVPE
jgi:hypothetical protein